MAVASSVPHKHQIISDNDSLRVGYFSQGGKRLGMFEEQGTQLVHLAELFSKETSLRN